MSVIFFFCDILSSAHKARNQSINISSFVPWDTCEKNESTAFSLQDMSEVHFLFLLVFGISLHWQVFPNFCPAKWLCKKILLNFLIKNSIQYKVAGIYTLCLVYKYFETIICSQGVVFIHLAFFSFQIFTHSIHIISDFHFARLEKLDSLNSQNKVLHFHFHARSQFLYFP